MKKIRIFALMLVVALCFGIGFAYAEEDDGFYDPTMMHLLDCSVEEWLLSPELRALYAVLMHFELYEVPEFNMEYMMDTYSDPVIYVTVPADVERQGIGVMMFYTEANTVYSASYYPILEQYTAFQTDISLAPDSVMASLSSEGLFEEYYPVTSEEYYAAALALDECFDSEE